MKMISLKKIDNSRAMVILGLSVLLLGVTYFLNSSYVSLEKISVVNEGVQTCFNRVSQTFNSVLVSNSNGTFTRQSFFLDTEDCFGEVLHILNKELIAGADQVKKHLNELSLSINSFHEQISSSSFGVAGSKELRNAFYDIETLKFSLEDQVTTSTNSQMAMINKWQNIFYLLFIALPLLLVFDLISSFKKKELRTKLETRATDALSEGDFANGVKVEGIINDAFEANQLPQVKHLFHRYHEGVLEGNIIYYQSRNGDKSNGDFAFAQQGNVSEKAIDKIWNPPKLNHISELTQEEEVNASLDLAVTRALDATASKFFTSGIGVDLDISEEIKIDIPQEDIDQVIYHLISLPLEGVDNTKSKHVGISLTSDNKVVRLEILDDTDYYTIKSEKDMPVAVMICKELLKGTNGDIAIKNLQDADGHLVGSKISLEIELDQTQDINSPKLVNLRRGTKKEILKQISG